MRFQLLTPEQKQSLTDRANAKRIELQQKEKADADAELASQSTAASGLAVGKAIEAAISDPQTLEDERLKVFRKRYL